MPTGSWVRRHCPSWAVEVALTIERPVDPHPEGLASETARPWPATEEPEGSRPPDPLRGRAQAQAIVLLRASGRANWLAGIAEVAAEVETAAGVRACRRCRHGDGERGGHAVAPAHGSAALWTGADSSRRRAGPAWSCRSARAPGSSAAVATGGGSGAAVVAGEGGIRPDLRWSVRRVGPGGGRAPWCWAYGCDRSPAGRCPGAPGLAGGAHLGSRRRARPWRVPGARPGTRSRTRRRQRSRCGMGCGRPPRPARPPPRPSRRPSAGGPRGGGPRGFRRAGGGAVRDLPGRGRSGSLGSICRVLAVAGSDSLRLRRPSRTTSVQAVDSGMHA